MKNHLMYGVLALFMMAGMQAHAAQLDVESEHFIYGAFKANAAEIHLGKLAAQQSSNARVREFGQTLATDHGLAQEQLRTIANNFQMRLPEERLSGHHRWLSEQLSNAKGADFDRMFLRHMAMGHLKAIHNFEDVSRTATAPELRDYASNSLPKLRAHLTTAESLLRETGGSAGMMDMQSDRAMETSFDRRDARQGSDFRSSDREFRSTDRDYDNRGTRYDTSSDRGYRTEYRSETSEMNPVRGMMDNFTFERSSGHREPGPGDVGYENDKTRGMGVRSRE